MYINILYLCRNGIIYLYKHNLMNIQKKSKVYPQRFVPDKHAVVYHMAGTSKEDRVDILKNLLIQYECP